MSHKLTKSRIAILEAAIKGFAIAGHLASADGLVPAEAWMRKGRGAKKPINHKDVDALYRADLFDMQWQGLGNWTGAITEAGRAVLREHANPKGTDHEQA